MSLAPQTSSLGLSTYRWNNNIKSFVLLGMFPLLLMTLLSGVFYAYGAIYSSPAGFVSPIVFRQFNLDTSALTQFNLQPTALGLAVSAVYSYWPIMLGIATVWMIIGYVFNSSIIHLATGAQPVTRQIAPRLYNLLENLCISRGMKTPDLYIIDTDVMNAYASGINEGSYAITVTQGLLDQLDDKEVEAVLGHELTHIINRDCRLLIITIVFVGMISFIAQMMWRSLQFSSYSNRRERGGSGTLVLMLIASVALVVGYVLALVLRFAISRRREFLADAGSVELTKNPEALISALRKISGSCDVPHVPSEVRQMFIENPPSLFDGGGLFATHPPIAARIDVLQALGGLPPEGHSMIPKSVG